MVRWWISNYALLAVVFLLVVTGISVFMPAGTRATWYIAFIPVAACWLYWIIKGVWLGLRPTS
jgi:hypothetical protein